ncbi:Structural maintenance of chromosomes protein 2, partial [Friedmanniomyces endolithicus]
MSSAIANSTYFAAPDLPPTALHFIDTAIASFHKLPGSAIALRYIRSSYQDDPVRSLVELFLFIFAERMSELDGNKEKLGREIGVLEEDMEKVRAARDKELRKGGKFARLEEAVKEHSHELVRLATILDLKQVSLAEEQDRMKKAQASVKDLEKQLKQRSEAHKQLQQRFEESNKEVEEQTAEVEKKEELLQTLQTGISSNAGSDGGY